MSLLAHRGRLAAAAVTGAALAAATVVATPALAGSSRSTGPRILAPASDAVALASLQGDFGLTRAQAQQRIAAQQHLSAVARQLTARLGSEAAGSYIDQRTGDLVVNVLDRSAAATVRAAGATPHVVTRSLATLDAIKGGLDAAARAHHAGRAMSWYVDVPTDTVHVTVPAGATDAATRAFVAQAKRAGDAVKVIATTAHLSTTNLYGGDQVEMSNGYICSLGFNAYDSAGRSVFLTAGHCAAGYPTFTQNGSYIGGTRAYTFPGNDYAFVNIDNPAAWAPQPVVDEHNGYGVYVYGASQAAVGSSVCKSGRTTGWTCGTIQAYNVTVNYPQGTVYGLTQASACVEGGDSGGSWMSGNYAQGLTSGAQTYNGYCGQYVGYSNVSFYQPVTAALSAYGLRLQTP